MRERMELKIRVLEKNHHRENFQCGNSMLDNYLKKQARQDVDRNLSACFVLINRVNEVKGYYTLSANSVLKKELPETLQKKLPPSYEELPCILLGRLAIDNTIKRKGFGEILLLDALNRSVGIAKELGSLAILVEPIDTIAEHFYEAYGFIHLPDSKKMFIAMKTVANLIIR